MNTPSQPVRFILEAGEPINYEVNAQLPVFKTRNGRMFRVANTYRTAKLARKIGARIDGKDSVSFVPCA